MVTYKIGSTGQGVKDLQNWLNRFGFNNGTALKVDGQYGQITANAVKSFQKAENIVQDGVCGPVTLGYMYDYGKSHSKTGSTSTNTTVSADLQKYLVATKNCQVTNTTIVAVSKSIVNDCTTTRQKAEALFNWVRDKTDYSWYDNTKYGALREYQIKKGNCCDMAHLNVAFARAQGIPARYRHVSAKFSSGTFGHVVAQFYVNGSWLTADATSNNNSLGVVKNWTLISEKGTYAELPF